jgi:putative ATP-dependent endonuclease of OLD family
MYLSEVKLWNFRKYGTLGDDPENPEPGLILQMQPGLNVLIGENDSGKTAIIDALRYTLGTQSGEWIRYEDTDFHCFKDPRTTEFQIECILRGFTPTEAGPFLEWLGFEEYNGKKEYVLHLRLRAQRKRNRITAQLRAGPDFLGTPIDGEARERLRVTYLKPLRDAEIELTAGRRSRFAQILRAHPLFQRTIIDGEPQQHDLEKYIAEANEKIRSHFKPEDGDAGALLRTLNRYLEAFFTEDDNRSASVTIAGSELHDILKRLELSLEDNRAGLGTLNLLYIAAELLLLHSDSFPGLRLVMIEELEAHLHPQAQLRLVDFLSRRETTGQYILTTHSTTLGASVDLKKLIICQGNEVFPMGPDFTELAAKNYEFLSRFLDATKANLFFAKGVILVEGDSENLLIPTIAEIINRPLHRYGVSIVNVGSTAFSHYEKVFIRNDGQSLGIKVAVVTDLDIKPLEWRQEEDENPPDEESIEKEKKAKHASLSTVYTSTDVQRFVAPNWTLEYEIALSKLRKSFYHTALWAKKKQNAVDGQPKESKLEEVIKQVSEDFDSWESKWDDDRLAEKIAFEIYQVAILDKNVSKAILAQEFAKLLLEIESEEEGKSREALLKSPSLSYLINAICHVTEPLPKNRA